MTQVYPWCWVCDGPHDPCEAIDLRFGCVICDRPIEDDDETAGALPFLMHAACDVK